MEAGGSKVLEAEQVKGTCRAQRGVKALREVYPVPGFLYITCKLCSYGIEHYQQRCLTRSKKTQNLHRRIGIPGSPSVASHVGRTRDKVRQHMAPELVVPAFGVQVVTVVAILAIAPWNIATLVTQPYVMVAVVLGASEPVRSTLLPLIGGETTQLSESWYSVSKVSDACQSHNIRFWCLLATLPLDVSNSRSWYSMMNFLTRLILTFR